MTAILAFLATAQKWPWKLIAGLAGAVALIFLTHAYGASEREAGALAERGKWNAVMEAARMAAAQREADLKADIAELEEQAQNRTRTRTVIVERARQDIADAESTEARLAVLSALRGRLRDDAAEHHARALDRYLSSIGAGSPG